MKSFINYLIENPSKAIEFLRKAFVKRNPIAAFNLGELYRDGIYLTASKSKALDMFNKSSLWSLNVPYNISCLEKAVYATRLLNCDKSQIEKVENSTSFTKDDLTNHLISFYSIPFVGSSLEVAEKLVGNIDDIFISDISYEKVKSKLNEKDCSLLIETVKAVLRPMLAVQDQYLNLCKKYNIVPKEIVSIDLLEFYPYPSLEVLSKVAENIVVMFLSIRCSQNEEFKPFSFALEDENFLTLCEKCNDDDIQLFMISILEAKLEIDSYLTELSYLYRACAKRDYKVLSCSLNLIKEKISQFGTELNIEPENLENIISFTMFDNTEKGNEDELDRLLREFIDAELKGDIKPFEDEDEDENDGVNASVPVNIERVDFAYDFNKESSVSSTHHSYFRKCDGENLHVNLLVDNPKYREECWGAKLVVELVSCSGVVWVKSAVDIFVESDLQTYTVVFTFSKLNPAEGSYKLRLYKDTEVVGTYDLHIIDLPTPYTKCIDFGGFSISRIELDDQFNVGEDSQNCFDINNLAGVSILAWGENILSVGYEYQFIIRIYNELGIEIFTVSREANVDGKDYSDKSLFICEQCIFETWERGTYKVEVEFYNEVVAAAEFVVGDRDVRAMYHKNSVQPMTNIGGREIIREVENPMEKLDRMIGLKEVKDDIKLLMSKAELDRKRVINGLKVKPISLHAAFLGNPGTGKTTVAKLLGQIYKDMGLLSKGHVVVEERSTLGGQNWNSEGDLTNKAIEKAKGGILFIDEAYDLVTDHPHDPGRLIISTLLSALADENNRDWMLILAGYPAPMEKLLNVNEGFRSRLQKFNFRDFSSDELFQVAESWLVQNDYIMTEDARKAFEALLVTASAQKDNHFGNARYVCDLLEKKVIPAMSTRLVTAAIYDSVEVLKTIEYEDIPNANRESESDKTISKLEAMVGLDELKCKIKSHLDFVRFVNMRRSSGIATTIPPLHMIFMGNPGTGKTTVADYLGEIYRSMGLLSVGRVIKVSRADMIGRYGDTEQTMKTLLSSAKGNILFIDEAYTLFSKDNPNDPGNRAVEMLLDTLSRESIDMIVIMAGYTKDMEDMLRNANQGLIGRFPYKFEFNDYAEEDLLMIAEGVCEKNNLTMSADAREAISALIKKEYRVRDANFSNARFVVRLITTQIMPNMGSRITKIVGDVDNQTLTTILAEDVPISSSEILHINNNLFDEVAIRKQLDRLDSLVGLCKVKKAIHEFVDMSREMSSQNRKFIGNYPLKWSFSGNSGTGKSTVAEILSEILKSMYLLGKGHLIEVKAEELYAGNAFQANDLLKKRMKESQQGLLFVDGDAPQFRSSESRYDPEYLRMCLAANTVEMPGTYAIVIAEIESPRQRLVCSLAQCGITDFDHTLIFEDYSQEELLEILKRHLSNHNLSFDIAADAIMSNYIKGLCDCRRSDYANARTMKLLARSIHKLVFLSGNVSGVVVPDDLVEFTKLHSKAKKVIGY